MKKLQNADAALGLLRRRTQGNDRMHPSAVARFFTSGLLRQLASRGQSRGFVALVREASVIQSGFSGKTVGDVFEHAFAFLKQRSNRDEYVYKSAITHKVLMGTHSLSTASMLTEFRVGDRKADVVILNGTGTAYEIKSERDSLTRLRQQVFSFSTVFPRVNVIVGEAHLSDVTSSIPLDIGVMTLSDRYQISTVREATHNIHRTSSVAMFESLNMKEAELILRNLGIGYRSVPNTQRYGVLRSCFERLDQETTHSEMVSVLKRTRSLASLAPLIDSLPPSLHSLALTTKVRKKDYSRLIEAVATPLDRAMLWT